MLAPHGKFGKLRVGIGENAVYKGNPQPLLYQIQNDVKAGNSDVPLKPLQGFVVAQQLLLQNGPGAGAVLTVDDGFLQQLFNGHLPARERMVPPADPHKGLSVQQEAIKPCLVKK